MRRPYVTESAISPGCAVIQGTADNKVKVPGEVGGHRFIGVYAFEANETKAPGDSVGIVLYGVAKVLAGGNVTAGEKAIIADESGAFCDLPEEPGTYVTCGTFLESGVDGEYVDMIVERGSVTVAAAE